MPNVDPDRSKPLAQLVLPCASGKKSFHFRPATARLDVGVGQDSWSPNDQWVHVIEKPALSCFFFPIFAANVSSFSCISNQWSSRVSRACCSQPPTRIVRPTRPAGQQARSRLHGSALQYGREEEKCPGPREVATKGFLVASPHNRQKRETHTYII